jgi:alpha 1,3-glucosidase
MYNLDVFEYELDNPMALYGSIPMMIGHNEDWTGGLLFLNAAEMWIDVARPGGLSEKKHLNKVQMPKAIKQMGNGILNWMPKPIKKLLPRSWKNTVHALPVPTEDAEVKQPAGDASGMQTHWMAESGLLDVFLFPGSKGPHSWRRFFSQYSHVTGTTTLPNTFAIAYHQCRWNYNDEEDVSDVNDGFDREDIPVDVIWLDIEHTDGKRYFTWDKIKFPAPFELQTLVAERGRKMVTIVDPHIKKDEGYHVYQEARDKGLLVKTKDNGEFDGWCWPGSSVWPDYVNPDTRSWWASLFNYNKYLGSSKTLFTWNVRSEPLY